MIILCNLTNKFQPLDLSINKAVQAYISVKYNTWIANKISKQLKKGINLPNVKVFLILLVVKPLTAKWIVHLHHHLKADKKMLVNGFRAAGIPEAIDNALNITERVENSFKFFSVFLI